MQVAVYRRLQLPAAPIIVGAATYRALHAYVQARGIELLPSLDVLRSQAGREVRLPSGAVVARCVDAPPWRRDVAQYMTPPRSARMAATADSAVDDIACDMQLASSFLLLVQGQFAARSATIVIASVVMGLLSAAVPWVVRASLPQLSGAVAGSTPAEATAFVLLTAFDVALQIAMLISSALLASAGYFASHESTKLLAANIAARDRAQVGCEDANDREGSRPARAAARVVFVPLGANAPVPPNVQHAVALAADDARRRLAAAGAMRGAVALDSTDAVRSVLHRLHFILGNMSRAGTGHDSAVIGFMPSGASLVVSLTLAVVFSVAPDVVAAADPAADTAALRMAALVPTCVMLLSFSVNACVLLSSFLVAGRIIDDLRAMHATVLRWQAATSAVAAQYLARRRIHALRSGGGATEGAAAAGAAAGAAAPPIARLDDDLAELAVVADAQRTLAAYLVAAIEDSGGIRFLGVFRPGATSVGGLLAVAVSASVLGLRLAVGVRDLTLPPQ